MHPPSDSAAEPVTLPSNNSIINFIPNYNNGVPAKNTTTNFFKSESIAHQQFIKLIEYNNWLPSLPKRDKLLFQFMEHYGFDRKQLLDKYKLYLKKRIIQPLNISTSKAYQMVHHNGKWYNIHNVTFHKDGIRFKRYGYCVRKGCKGAIKAGKMLATRKDDKFPKFHEFIQESHPHCCDKKMLIRMYWTKCYLFGRDISRF